MNGFEKFNLDHASASSINLWAACPHMFIAQYLFQKKSPLGAAAKSGILVEEAIVNVLARGFTVEQATTHALTEYHKFTGILPSKSDTDRGNAMSGMIELALQELAPYGTPEFDKTLTGDFKQKKIEILCNGDGWSLPIIGYLDLHFPHHGITIDLKSTMRMPSEMSDAHRRQACIYQHAMGNQTVKFLYVTGKKSTMFDCGDTKETLGNIKTILNRQETFLRAGDKDFLRSIVHVGTDSFYFDADITKELYGL